ncbi:hypothetical protein [Xanthomonas citri]|uniref:hypothetical protein n=1 Tax=Xanthomonas citri TaxID=346 RepID=UPI00159A479E|nr:hypothetical protein [Xanthomonas citri]MBE0315559.1 hypothetical protein [Xanthomonas citri pv. punicae]MDS0832484.1 hypothetical protein [Xanthomonas citri pv. punicae]MDS0836349.1 hypothetical protein [Xanthomonas citri pv. punicae]QCZ72250.1 hypothetical protein CAB38_04845 [Xanthomonas citri pv. punicae]
MQHDHVQPLNYCAHAIEDIKVWAKKFQHTAPQSAHVMLQVIEMLRHSVKFILPNRCNLVAPDDIRQAHLDLARLPFPCVAFEVPYEQEIGLDPLPEVGGLPQLHATRRIALCWEPHPSYELLPHLNDIVQKFADGGAFIVPLYWTPFDGKWNLGIGGSFHPYKNELRELVPSEQLPVSRIANDALIEAGRGSARTKQFRSEPFVLQPELFAMQLAEVHNGDRAKAFAQIHLDAHDEEIFMIEACSVINCANVTTAELPAPKMINKKREAKGKQPFFTYKVLQLVEERREGGKGESGHHASPRMHLRRGHLRRLESKTVWVRATMVNATSTDGVVVKDYAVPPRPAGSRPELKGV